MMSRPPSISFCRSLQPVRTCVMLVTMVALGDGAAAHAYRTAGDAARSADEISSAAACGDGAVDADEQCDDGDAVWTAGQACDADCTGARCGMPFSRGQSEGRPTAVDALFTLRAATGGAACAETVCDVNGSQLITALDGLHVLRAAIGLPPPFRCPTLPGVQTFELALDTDAECYGIHIDVTAVDSPGLWCEWSEAAVAAQCSARPMNAGGVGLRDCFLADGTTLFQCTGSADAPAAVAQHATVACGCGCAETCPSGPAIDVVDEEQVLHGVRASAAVGSADYDPQPSHTSVRPARTASSLQTPASTTTSSTSGTYCDIWGEQSMYFDGEPELAELELNLWLTDPDCAQYMDCDVDTSLPGVTSIRPDGDNGYRVCVAGSNVLSASQYLVDCEWQSGGEADVVVEVTRALGSADLRPVTPPPVIRSE